MSRVLVTGAGSGLGRAIAAAYSADHQVLVTDVDATTGARVAAELNAEFLHLDVTDDSSWQRARAWCEEHWGGLDILVNNAGVGAGGRIERIPMADWDWIWEINVKGVVRGCHTFVPLFKAQHSGHLVNVASLAAIMNLPGMASYNVTKGAVLALSETLRHELAPDGITTTVVCPGYFQTNLGDRSRTVDPAVGAVSEKLMASSGISAADVARQVVEAVADKQFMVLTHPEGRESARLKRLDPDAFGAQVAQFWDRLRPAIEQQDSADRDSVEEGGS
ncbi:SDR family NAD(P)-dependent oxidoreductase [Actinokineospora sp. NBRC 105648]|uniref:SDR family NAD(P)-dependent oxidoreductase n=1 Tax=Actinokineospora sp. NBRC 105648 TaxID=3032206 RepID=UPI0024A1D78E|nr:SDR family NAD(P)-dependent oxidoreductase [Actinokineospora sp. NBRC 105648]GLZ37818.1 short chain dehydrogenase [Actinokineospora sp. NBRC 105648]